MDKTLVATIGTLLIWFIYWFFFGKKPSPAEALPTQAGREGHAGIDIVVDGGYKPSVIKVEKGETTKISLLRKDSNSCLEDFIFPDFKIKRYLPLNKRVEIEILPMKTGEFKFHCGMNMYQGKIVVS